MAALPEIKGPSLGWQVAHWIETLLCHGPGDIEGEPIAFDTEFLSMIVRAYRVAPKTGRRHIRRYILSRAKGRAKSELAGELVCAEALGPVQFDHWATAGETSWWGYEYEKGEPVGIPRARPFVRCLATEETQAGNTFDNVFFMLTDERSLVTGEVSGLDVGLTRVYFPGGEIRPSTASNAAKDGGKETFSVFDETHLYVLPDLKRMHRTVRRNLTKRNGWSLETTTMFEVGAESIAEETYRAIDASKARPDTVFDHREGPDPDSDFDWDDDDQLRTALGEAYGEAAEWVDLDARIADIRDPTSEKADSVRFFLNRAASSANDIVPVAQWDQLEVETEPLAGDVITVGFDGSDSDDGTALVAVRGSDGLTWPLGLWEKDPTVKDWKVPRHEVHQRLAETMSTFRVVRMYCDPRLWETDIDEWAALYGEKVVLRLPQSDKRLWQAASRFVTLVNAALQTLERDDDEPSAFAERICHNGDPDLRRHLLNSRRKRVGGRLRRDGAWVPEKKHPSRKIDLLAAALNGHVARGDAIAAGELTEVSADPLSQIF